MVTARPRRRAGLSRRVRDGCGDSAGRLKTADRTCVITLTTLPALPQTQRVADGAELGAQGVARLRISTTNMHAESAGRAAPTASDGLLTGPGAFCTPCTRFRLLESAWVGLPQVSQVGASGIVPFCWGRTRVNLMWARPGR
jgi:hypothetical protein